MGRQHGLARPRSSPSGAAESSRPGADAPDAHEGWKGDVARSEVIRHSEAMDEVELSICQMAARLISKKTVTPNQRLYHDLKLRGDDAFVLFESIGRRFGTSFTGCHFPDYFPNESEAITDGLETRLGFGVPRCALTIRHLAEVVRRGQWFTP